MGPALEANKTMTVLDIEPKMSPFAFRVLLYSLRRNLTLHSLLVSIVGDDKDGDKSVLELFETLKVNRTLKVVWNHSYTALAVGDETKDSILHLLEVRPLEKFHLFDEDAFFWLKKKAALEQNKDNLSLCNPCDIDIWTPWSDEKTWAQEFKEDQEV